MKESEKSTEAYLFKQMRKIGGSAHKYMCPSHRGKPDRICEFPNGLVAFVEVKSEGKKPEPHQLREHERMKKRGQIIEVIDTKAGIDKFIELYGRIDYELKLCEVVEGCRESIRKLGFINFRRS
jgi:hypothetical protein